VCSATTSSAGGDGECRNHGNFQGPTLELCIACTPTASGGIRLAGNVSEASGVWPSMRRFFSMIAATYKRRSAGSAGVPKLASWWRCHDAQTLEDVLSFNCRHWQALRPTPSLLNPIGDHYLLRALLGLPKTLENSKCGHKSARPQISYQLS
jgi:hypothetical protein